MASPIARRRGCGVITCVLTLLITTAACGRDEPAFLPDATTPSTVMNDMAAAIPVGQSAMLIAEPDFLAAMTGRVPSAASPDTLDGAVRIATLANSSAVLGAFGEIHPTRTTFSGDLFVVVRDPSRGRDHTFVEAKDFYLANVRLSGRAGWIGRNPQIALDGDIPLPTRGNCGLLNAPGERAPCPGPRCPPASFQMGVPQAGDAGALGSLNVPLHVFDPSGFTLWICQPFDRRPDGPIPGDIGREQVAEVCNGLDDDSDGSIDENGVCANRDVMCRVPPAKPVAPILPIRAGGGR